MGVSGHPGIPVAEGPKEAEGLSIVPSPIARVVEYADGVLKLAVEATPPTDAGDPGNAVWDDPKRELIAGFDEVSKVELVNDEI